MKRVLVSNKFCVRKILGQTVWLQIRLGPPRGWEGEKDPFISMELGNTSSNYFQGAWGQDFNFGELHDFSVFVGMVMVCVWGGAMPLHSLNTLVPFNSFSQK